ncbi:hypothetical protein GCM10010911_59950 [Paenibacillus nasutitermitis]|uniref:DEAD/DEAH box helicase n=1 Tax=Paenibacillus nasutitermitis TaxID=1652958 RepID=A0A916ZF38_9BACL|nr:DEAD/DEAH box helicase [Paenibacillus nasutitermitis]GGD93364.1 hypothetical protein GCM10010911_59950 [Paenibacillus nasutitermitis]
MAGFEELGIATERAAALHQGGIQQATPIQEAAIPVIMSGSDVICQAQTGTGKTLAFLLPMLEKIRPEKDELQGLILTPTRELALQITNELKRWLASKTEFSVLAVYGGQDVEAQMRKLKRAVHMIVATPGRLLDHIRRETISLASVKMFVLDEADQMLHLGFLNEVEEIMTKLPYRKQTMLFSATMPGNVRSLASRIMLEPKDITVKAPKVTVKGIRQLVVETSDRNKQSTLVRLLEEHRPYLGVIFCRTKRRAKALNEGLQELGYVSDELHGDLSQAKREQVMKRFRDAKLQFLVATDVAARGLDVEGVTHVFNYDVPQDVDSYIHRIGRTARAGGEGLAITLVVPNDRIEMAAIEHGINQKLERERGSGVGLHAEASEVKPDRQGAGRSGGRRNDRDARERKPASRGRSGGRQAAAPDRSDSRGRGRSGGRSAGTGGETFEWGAGRTAGGAGRSGGRPDAAGRAAKGARAGAARGSEARPGGGRRSGEGREAYGAGAARGSEARPGSGRRSGEGREAHGAGAARGSEARPGSGRRSGEGREAHGAGAARGSEFGERAGAPQFPRLRQQAEAPQRSRSKAGGPSARGGKAKPAGGHKPRSGNANAPGSGRPNRNKSR